MVTQEKLIPLKDVPQLKWLPRRNGKSVHIGTVFRWANNGVRGVKLSCVSVGRTKCTTQTALIKFFQDVAARDPSTDRRSTPNVRIESALKERGLL